MSIPPILPTSGQEIFDQLMAQIEPDLTSSGLEGLTEKYKNETPEEFSTRKARYVLAFKEYDKQFQVYLDGLKAGARQYKHENIVSLENANRAKENQQMQSLESSFVTA